MARLNITHLPAPPSRYRIDRLPPAPEGRLLFETKTEKREEDNLRAKSLRADSTHPLIDPTTALDLADRLGGPVSGCVGCLASSRYMRKLRIKIIGNLWRLVDEQVWPLNEVSAFTILPEGWAFTPETLHQADPKKLLERFRSQLRRQSWGPENGSLIAGIDGEFEPESGVYQFHLHGFATRDMVSIVDSLRALPAYRPRHNVASPVRIGRKTLEKLPYPLGYPFKSYWPSRRIGAVGDDGVIKRQRGHHRIPEPYQSQVLLWLDRWSVSDMVLLMNMRVGPDGFVITHNKNVHQFKENGE